MERVVIRFAGSVAANGTANYEREVAEDGYLSRLVCRFPPGPEGDLHITPYIRTAQRSRRPILLRDDAQSANEYLSGDDYAHDLAVSIPIRRGEFVGIDVQNTDASNAHFFDFFVELEGRVAGRGA